MSIPVNWEVVDVIRRAREKGLSPEDRLKFAIAAKDCVLEAAVSRASEKQIAFANAFFDRRDIDGRKKSIFAAIGGNRSGKTFVGGVICFATFLRECAVDGDTFWCVSQNLDRSITGQQRELWDALPKGTLVDEKGQQQTWSEKIGFGGHRKILVRCRGGGKALVEFRSADQDPNTFEQAKLRGAWVDEACPEEIYNRLLGRIIDLDGWIIFTDIRHQWWQEERLFSAPPESAIHCVQFCMMDNEHILPPGAIAQARANMTADEASMRIDGNSGLSEGIVFKQFTKDQVVDPFEIPPNWPKWRAIDYGSSAPTACLWLTISPNECVYVYREYYEVSPSCAHSAKMILAKSPPDETLVCTFIDPHAIDTPPGVYIMAPTVARQFATGGIRTRGWPYIQTIGEHACVEKIKLRDERKTIKVFNTCTNHVRERRNWKHKTDKDGNPVASDAYENEHSHTNDIIKGFLATNPCYSDGQRHDGGYSPPDPHPDNPKVPEQERL